MAHGCSVEVIAAQLSTLASFRFMARIESGRVTQLACKGKPVKAASRFSGLEAKPWHKAR
jgi:hypothetical protein